MSYVPHTAEDIRQMLEATGVSTIEGLFSAVPAQLKKSPVSSIAANSEQEIRQKVRSDLALNVNFKAGFLGAGAYAHYIPAVVDQLTGRSEFYTAYTPYQPEISQGTLTAIFEFQTMICELAGLDIANASMYDGASAAAEAGMLAASFTGRKELLLANTLHPNYIEVIKTYAAPRGIVLRNGTDISENTAAVLFALPDFYGKVAEYIELIKAAKAQGALAVIIADPLLLSVVEAPGKLGADIVVGEGRPLGIPQWFGGPGVGFFAAKKELLRFMPGRIVGETIDKLGRKAFVLTMQTREQHIRREKATSNICSNQAWCALRATIYLSTMGPQGLKKVVRLILKRMTYAQKKISALPGYKLVTQGDSFREFVIECPAEAKKINQELLKENILGGYDLGGNKMLVCCTELTTEQDIDILVEKLKAFASVGVLQK